MEYMEAEMSVSQTHHPEEYKKEMLAYRQRVRRELEVYQAFIAETRRAHEECVRQLEQAQRERALINA